MYFASVVVALEINRRHNFRSNLHTNLALKLIQHIKETSHLYGIKSVLADQRDPYTML